MVTQGYNMTPQFDFISNWGGYCSLESGYDNCYGYAAAMHFWSQFRKLEVLELHFVSHSVCPCPSVRVAVSCG